MGTRQSTDRERRANVQRMWGKRWLGAALVVIAGCGRDTSVLDGGPAVATLAPNGGVCCPIDYTIGCTQQGYFGGWQRTGAQCVMETWFDGCPFHRESVDEHGCRVAEVTPVCEDGWHCLAGPRDVRRSDATTVAEGDAWPSDAGASDASDFADVCSLDECSR